jgi:ABC-type bacteriocin/lantibiotic exporter with double-glycine peptidase domain
MKLRVELPLFRKIPSYASIWLVSFFAAVSVFSIAILLQWLIYDDWMHDNGQLRLVGSALALVLTFLFTLRWQLAKRRQMIEVMRRFETIRWMNDRIRNSLQTIECRVFATHPHVTDPVRDAVDAIENVLQELLNQTHSQLGAQRRSLSERSQVADVGWFLNPRKRSPK